MNVQGFPPVYVGWEPSQVDTGRSSGPWGIYHKYRSITIGQVEVSAALTAMPL